MGVVTALATIAVVAGTAACGIPADDGPVALPLPPGIPTTTTASSPPPPAPALGELTATICLIRNQSLVPTARQFETAPSPRDLLRDLVDGATAEEEEQGLSSLLEGIETLSVANLDNGIADIDVGTGLDEITGGSRLLIYGQIVCTLDGHPEIVGVVFSQGGQRLTVARGDASPTDSVLTADDYVDLLEPTATATS